MYRKLLTLSIILLCVGSVSASPLDWIKNLLGLNGEEEIQTPIGYEYIEEFLHTWNQNPNEAQSNIWFNESSGFLQFYNGINLEDARDRSTWLTHSFGLAYYTPNGEFRYMSKDHLNNISHLVESDNETFWREFLYKCLNQTQGPNKKEFCAGWKRGQGLDDLYMKNHFYFSVNETQGPFTFLRNQSYTWAFKSINIDNDFANDDYAKYCYYEAEQLDENTTQVNNNCEYLLLSNLTDMVQRNIHSFEIYDIDTNNGHVLLWEEDTRIDIRVFEGEIMIEAPFEEQLINWTGLHSIKMWWIDTVSCTEGQPEAGIHQSILCPLNSEGYSGYINTTVTGIGAFINSTHRDRQPQMGEQTFVPFQTTWEKESFICFNTSKSDIPAQAHSLNVTAWTGSAITQDTINKPANWRTRFKISHLEVTDNITRGIGGDTGLDWNDSFVGNASVLIDWDSALGNHISCPGLSNLPCETMVFLTKNNSADKAFIVFNESLQSRGELKEIYCVIQRDESLFNAGEKWQWIWDITGAPLDTTQRFHLNISFGLPDSSFTVKQMFPDNNTIFNNSLNQININFTVDVTGDYFSNFCDFNINNTIIRNNSDVGNGSIGINQTLDGVGAYFWETNCTDQFGFEAFSGRSFFNLTGICGTNYDETGDFIIDNDVLCVNEDFTVNGDLLVQPTGSLILNNTNLSIDLDTQRIISFGAGRILIKPPSEIEK